MSNKGLSKHTLKSYSKKKPQLRRYIKQGYEEHTLLPNRSIRHRKWDRRNPYKIVEKYLESKVGCNWNDVYSELRSKIGYFKVEDYIKSFTIKKYKRLTWSRYGKVYYSIDKKIKGIRPGEFYIDSNNLLQQVPKKRKINKVKKPIVIKIDDNHEYRYLENKASWYYYYKDITKKVKKRLVVDSKGKPVFYNRLNCKILDPMLLGTPMFTYQTVEKVTWERDPIDTFGNYHRLKLRNLGVFL